LFRINFAVPGWFRRQPHETAFNGAQSQTKNLFYG
jgi:hypothetical protein